MIGTSTGLGGMGGRALRCRTDASLPPAATSADGADNRLEEDSPTSEAATPEPAGPELCSSPSPMSQFDGPDTLVEPLPTPSPLAAALGGAGAGAPSPIRSLQDPWAGAMELDLSCITDADLTAMTRGSSVGREGTGALSFADHDAEEGAGGFTPGGEMALALDRAEISLLASLGGSDPTSALHEHYQSLASSPSYVRLSSGGRPTESNVPPQPTYRDIQHRDGRGATTGWWRSVLSCPILDRDFCSALPRSVWQEKDGDGGRWENIISTLGEFIESNDGYVYFKTKKGARKAAALCALEANAARHRCSGSNGDSDGEDRSSGTASLRGGEDVARKTTTRVMFHSRADVVTDSPTFTIGGRLFQESPVKSSGDTKEKDDGVLIPSSLDLGSGGTGRRRVFRARYPEWVERLHCLGVDPSAIEIRFKEKLPPSSWRQQQLVFMSKDYPTLLCCVMRIVAPIQLTAVSLPFQSTTEALESASQLIEEEARRQQGADRGGDARRALSDDEYAWEAREGLLRSAPVKTATYVHTPPAGFVAPIVPANATDRPTRTFYLYELDFSAPLGGPFVPMAMGLPQEVTTRMGMVFGRDITFHDEAVGTGGTSSAPPEARVVEAFFELPGSSGPVKVKVALRKRTVLNLPSNTRDDKILTMKRFNAVLCGWKQYGLVKWARSAGSVHLAEEHRWDDFKERQADGVRRTLVVPLCQEPVTNASVAGEKQVPAIDYDLMHRVVSYELQPYYLPLDRNWRIPYLGRIRSRSLAIAFALLAVAVATVGSNSSSQPDFVKWLAILAVAFIMLDQVPPKKAVTDDALRNRFLLPSVGHAGIYVTHATPRAKMQTAFLVRPPSNQEEVAQSHYDFYLQKLSTRLRYPRETLLQTRRVMKHAEEDLLRANSDAIGSINLPPELVHILPCPRDILYMCQHMERFMVPLERTVTLMQVEGRMNDLRERYSTRATKVSGLGTLRHGKPSFLFNLDEGKTTISLLDNALTLYPHIQYQRLEFLGDSVLGYFLSISLMARNASLKWDERDLRELFSVAARNEALSEAAHRIGLNRLLGVRGNKWKLAYSKHSNQSIAHDTSSSRLDYKDYQTNDLSFGTLSDVVESLLAVSFIKSIDVDGRFNGGIVVGLLNELELPLAFGQGKEPSAGFFHGLHASLDEGYPFELNKMWNKQIVNVGTTMIVHHDVDETLERGYKALCDILAKNSTTNLDKELSSQRTKILMRCALFDDSLSEFEESASGRADTTMNDSCISILKRNSSISSGSINRTSSTLDGLDLVGMLRETLYFVGNYALKLCLDVELYRRHQKATPGDLTLLRKCAFTDDCLSYIIVKNRIYECLYDQDSPAAAQFWLEMNIADERGLEAWEENGGWILGGVDDFRRRTKSVREADTKPVESNPRYPGLAGGLLRGKTNKLDSKLTDDLAFSMKAICGALVLGFGVEGMWSAMGPLFEETLILDPDELRQLFGSNSVCRTN